MPYITQQRREVLDPLHTSLLAELQANAWSPGEINYIITKIISRWWTYRPRYLTIALIFGTLVAVGLEFWRRRGVPYEDDKCNQNGDVYE